MDKAHTLWAKVLEELPMDGQHKTRLSKHWVLLHGEFTISNRTFG